MILMFVRKGDKNLTDQIREFLIRPSQLYDFHEVAAMKLVI